MKDLLQQISSIGIVPVIKINEEEDALPLAKALYDGGIDAIEVTFRSKHTIKAIEVISKSLPNMIIGAGTVFSAEQAKDAIKAGAKFIVTPGFNEKVVSWCLENSVCVLPGVSTASEIQTAIQYGLTHLKFFPAESSGGSKKLKDLSAPYQNITFMPTGGINLNNIHEYLALPNVMAIGGSFMLDENAIVSKDFDTIQKNAKNAVATMLNYELIHLGINQESSEQALETAKLLCNLFNFQYYKKPKSHFAGKGFEVLNSKGIGENGHIGIYTPYPERAMYHLSKQGISFLENTITRNKKTNKVNFVYLDLIIAGFGIHLINPDVKML